MELRRWLKIDILAPLDPTPAPTIPSPDSLTTKSDSCNPVAKFQLDNKIRRAERDASLAKITRLCLEADRLHLQKPRLVILPECASLDIGALVGFDYCDEELLNAGL